jgi:hypothetical protein
MWCARLDAGEDSAHPTDQKASDGSSMRRFKGGGWDYDPMGPLPVGVKDDTLRAGTEQMPDIGFRCAK